MELYTVEETARKIRKSVASIYSDLIRRPYALPPVIRIPGSSKVLFADVDDWLKKYLVVAVEAQHTETKRRGRPSKAESLRKRGGRKPKLTEEAL